jgi:hypothetical protein
MKRGSFPSEYRSAISGLIDNRGLEAYSYKAFSKAADAILRNLTTHEYVVHSGISHPAGTVKGPWNTGPVGFLEVLKCQIGFSDDPSISMRITGPADLHRGPWAGHRFDIISLDSFEAERKKSEGNDDKEWKDVTLEIRKKVKRIWDGEPEYNDLEFGPYPTRTG